MQITDYRNRRHSVVSYAAIMLFSMIGLLAMAVSSPVSAASYTVTVTGNLSEDGSVTPQLNISPAVPSSVAMGLYFPNGYFAQSNNNSGEFSIVTDFDYGQYLYSNPVLIDKHDSFVTLNHLSVNNDTLNEGTETGELCLDGLDQSDWTNAGHTLSFPNATITGSEYCFPISILDDDVPPTVGFSSASGSNAESVTSLSIPVSLNKAWTSAVTVDYAVQSSSTATGSGTDYTLANGTVTIAAGSTSGVINLTIANDSLDEADETVIVQLSNPGNASLSSVTSFTYTITDDDAAPTITLSNASIAESGTSLSYAVSLSAASGKAISVAYATADGTAADGSDYTGQSGTLNFAAGTTSQTITVPVSNDSLDEADETFTITLSSPSNVTVNSPTSATVTITDDDAAPTITLSNASIAESGTSLSYAVSLSAASGKAISVAYATADGTAADGSDYTGQSGTLNFAAGTTSQTITVPVSNDSLDEADETFTITLSSPSNVTVNSPTSATVTITDDDAAPTITLSNASIAESGTSLSYAVSLSAASGKAISVAYATADGTAADGSDYTGQSGTLNFAAGTTSQTITVPVSNDSLDEADETFTITLSSPSNVTVNSPTSATVTITDDDAAPTIGFATATSNGSETVSSAAISLRLSGSSASVITVDYAVSGTASGSGVDYILAGGTLSIPAGNSSSTITIGSIVNDAIYEGDETVVLTLSNPSNASLGSQTTHSYTISDDEAVPSLSIADVTRIEGNTGSVQPAVTVTLSHASSTDITVDYGSSDGTATTADSDYSDTTGTLTFFAGDLTKTIDPVIFGDSSYETDESFTLTLTNPSGATISDGTGQVTITNDDGLPDLTVSVSGVVVESSNATLNIALSQVAGLDVTFDYATADGTASAGSDYASTSGSATITAGSPDIDISVPLTDNALDHANKTFSFTISNPVNATLATASQTVTILDDELAISINDVTVNETDSTASFTVSVTGPTVQSFVDIDFTTIDGTATAGTDFVSSTGTVRVSSSATPPFGSAETETVTITLSDDALSEGTESFDVRLSNIQNASGVFTDDTGRATITDDETSPVLGFTASSSSGAESVSSAALALSLSTASSSAVSVNYTVSGTATGAGTDYTLADGSVTIPAGATTASITIASIVDDSLYEGDETVIVTLSSPSGASLSSQTTHSYTITDNDAASGLSVGNVTTADETASAQIVTVTLSAAAAVQVQVDYATSDGTATQGADYSPASGTLIFTPGQTSASFSVSILSDTDDEADETVTITLSNPVNATIGQAVATLTITDDDEAEDNSAIDKAVKYLKDTIISDAQEQGQRLIGASHKLIKTSVEHLIVRTRLGQNLASGTQGGGSQTASTSRPAPAPASTGSGFSQSVLAEPVTTILSPRQISQTPPSQTSFTSSEPTAGQVLADGVKMISAEADGTGYEARLEFDRYIPLVSRNDALITKLSAEMSDQDNGPETSRLIASVALEKTDEENEKVRGQYIHLTQEKSDYKTGYNGSQDSLGVALGMYRIYSPRVNQLLSYYGSAGMSKTDLSLKNASSTIEADYLSYRAQAGMALARTLKSKSLLQVYEFGLDGLYHYQTKHHAIVRDGLSRFSRLIAGKSYTELSVRLSPKYIFSLNDNGEEKGQLLTIAPTIKCGSGNGETSCGGGMELSLTAPFAKDNGFTMFGINVERYRDTDTISTFLDINRQITHEAINLNTRLNQTQHQHDTDQPDEMSLNTELKLSF